MIWATQLRHRTGLERPTAATIAGPFPTPSQRKKQAMTRNEGSLSASIAAIPVRSEADGDELAISRLRTVSHTSDFDGLFEDTDEADAQFDQIKLLGGRDL